MWFLHLTCATLSHPDRSAKKKVHSHETSNKWLRQFSLEKVSMPNVKFLFFSLTVKSLLQIYLIARWHKIDIVFCTLKTSEIFQKLELQMMSELGRTSNIKQHANVSAITRNCVTYYHGYVRTMSCMWSSTFERLSVFLKHFTSDPNSCYLSLICANNTWIMHMFP